tara:strand:- start:1275 stop:1451 length:177 start_codon:yes stop_codon:yes gene_type:complete
MIFINKNGIYVEVNKNNFYNDNEYIKKILDIKNKTLNIKKNNIENHILDLTKKKVEIM